ncbi:MAG: hypothetical protein CVV02_07305 [Firmicutes bacterium HGW-Firmicutes-7]|nr:MAG: hypothetical protein CVV02_07305 [Firmicutes bacterium HGW-Firmicutes-7]
MVKIKMFIDMDKEEQYLTDMAINGMIFKRKIPGGYYFEKAEGEKLNYRIDYRLFHQKADFQEYVLFLADAGWTLVDGHYNSGNQYFLSKEKMCDEKLFSDYSSKAGRYERYLRNAIISIFVSLIYIFLLSFVAIQISPDSKKLTSVMSTLQYSLLVIFILYAFYESTCAVIARNVYKRTNIKKMITR